MGDIKCKSILKAVKCYLYDFKGYLVCFTEKVSWSKLYTLSNMGITNIATYSTLTIPILANLVVAIKESTSLDISIPDTMAWFYLAGFLCMIGKSLVTVFCPTIIRDYTSGFEYTCYRVDMDIKAEELIKNTPHKEEKDLDILKLPELPIYDLYDYSNEWEENNRKLYLLRWIITGLYASSIFILIGFYGYKYPMSVYNAANTKYHQTQPVSSSSSSTSSSIKL